MELVLTSEGTDFSYSESFNYMKALYEEKVNQDKLNRYISECLIFAENSSKHTKFEKLKALNEEDGVEVGKTTTDQSSTSTGWLDRIMNFIKKIWGKFVEKITRYMTINNYYLEKYKDIILKKTPIIGDITFDGSGADFTKAITNITQVTLKVITEGEITSLPIKDDNGANEGAMVSKVCNIGTTPPNGQEVKAWLVDFFEGKYPAQPTTLSPSKLNFNDMYNFCHDINKITDIIKKDQDAVNKCNNTFIEALKKFNTAAQNINKNGNKAEGDAGKADFKELSDKIKGYQDGIKREEDAITALKKDFNDRISKTTDQTQKTNLQNQLNAQIKQHTDNINSWTTELEKLKTTQGEIISGNQQTQENTVWSNIYGKYLTEAEVSIGAAMQQNNGTRTTNTTFTNVQQAENNNNDKVEKQGEFYMTTVQMVVSAKLTACDWLYHQMMAIIRAHVASFVGQQNKTEYSRSGPQQAGTYTAPKDNQNNNQSSGQ